MQMTPRVIIVDRPGAQQSVILGGALSEDAGASEDPAAMAMNTIFGGDFGSRLNMNIREDKHWAYYAASSIDDTRGAPIFMINAPVQTDRTADSLREIIAEMNAINGRRPIQEAELSLVVNARRRQPPINFTTQQAMLNTMEHANASGRPLDFEVTLPQRYSELSIDEVQAAAREFIRPNSMTWVIVGDRQRIEASLAALNIAPIEIFAADGQVLRH